MKEIKYIFIKTIKALIRGFIGESKSEFICHAIGLIVYIYIGFLGFNYTSRVNIGIVKPFYFGFLYWLFMSYTAVETLLDNWDKVK